MNDVLIEGEPLELIQEAFRGMKARRDADGWVSVTGRLDQGPGESLLRALHRAEASLPRRLGSSRDEHRAAALDEIVRQFTVASGRAPGVVTDPVPAPAPVERVESTVDLARERFPEPEPGVRHLAVVPSDEGGAR